MPKELTHWWIAEEGLRRLPLDRPTRQVLEEQRDAYLIGAVLPDTLLHLLRGPYHHAAHRLADDFHDSRGHSYGPLLSFLARSPDPPAAQQACLLGIATHIEADIVFHPFVYAQAGTDLGRHYRIETDLDLWLLHTGKRPSALTLLELLSDEAFNVAVAVLAGVFDPNASLPLPVIDEALRLHATLQGRYGSRGWQLVARLLGLVPGTPFQRWQHLFYPCFFWQRGRDVSWPQRWLHPASGSERGDSPDGLVGEAITRVSTLLRAVDDRGLTTALRKQPGENLLTGLPPAC